MGVVGAVAILLGMSEPSWSSLSAAFPVGAVQWHAAERDVDADRIRLAAHLDPEALRGRLDGVAGPGGWSVRIRAWGESALIAELTVAGVTRSAVVRVCDAAGLAAGDVLLDASVAATGAAWSAAAFGFGMRPPLTPVGDGWVDAARGAAEPLFAPDAAELSAAGPGLPEQERSGVSGPDDAAVGPLHEAPASEVSPRPAPPVSSGPSADPPKSEAHQVIDRLVDRLRDEGLGADAARLVARYGGYGADADASRELYAKLRALLLERTGPA